MDTLNILSLIVFCIFLSSYVLKLVILYRKNSIKANVLAKGKKSSGIKLTERFVKITTFIWGATWFFMSLAEPYIVEFIGRHYNLPVVNFAGVGIVSVGCAVFILAMTSMRTSWRVGIDKSATTKLITRGVYRYSRNVAFVGFDLMFAGLYLMYPNSLTLIILVLNVLAIHLLILQEEKHLRLVFGEEYDYYCRKTPRYI
ncbi:methyltransferase family protein [Paenibacillus borealis]|uniref:Isoprenylcysteine carboxyl methyltransferase n=1 Tax=Paenibacillus borealis TaxID=160799 RepID=A0A089LIM1_PAEBO|nr:isoprenylcysteine carboxylmethyltransferase family protein [Paenibacillus borealis]AIQ61371.1 isoprenylcysteine carboxyl methyltransferase [Paenibacillus borealis]